MLPFFVFVCVTGLAFVFLKGITSNGAGCLTVVGGFMFICCLGVMTPDPEGDQRRAEDQLRRQRYSSLYELGLSDEEIRYHMSNPNLRRYTEQEKIQLIESAVKLERVLQHQGKW